MDSVPSYQLLQRLSPLSFLHNGNPQPQGHYSRTSLSKKIKPELIHSTQSTSPINNPFKAVSSNYNVTPVSKPNHPFQHSLSPIKPLVPKTQKKENPNFFFREVGYKNSHSSNKLDSLKFSKLFDEARSQASLPNILKVENEHMIKFDNIAPKDEKETMSKINEKMQKTFQKKELISPRLVPSVRNSVAEKPNVNEQIEAALNQRSHLRAQTFRIKTINSPYESPSKQLKYEENGKKQLETEPITWRENEGQDAPSFTLLSSRVQSEMTKVKIAPLRLSQLKQSQRTKTLSTVQSPKDKSPKLAKFKSHSPSPMNGGFGAEDHITANEVKMSINPKKPKLTSHEREKLNQMIQTKTGFLDREEEDSLDISRDSVPHLGQDSKEYSKNTLREAMAEYERNFHDRFVKGRKKKQQFEKSENFQPLKDLNEVERKWAQEIPLRRVFELAAAEGYFNIDKMKNRSGSNKYGGRRIKAVSEEKEDALKASEQNNENNEENVSSANPVEKFSKFKRIRTLLRAKLIKYANLKLSLKQVNIYL